jgi:hypothetical protein
MTSYWWGYEDVDNKYFRKFLFSYWQVMLIPYTFMVCWIFIFPKLLREVWIENSREYHEVRNDGH